MSGSPKFSIAELARQMEARLAEQRRQQAAREAQRREEAAARERQRRFEAQRQPIQQQVTDLAAQLQAQKSAVYATAAATLQRQLAQQATALRQATTETQLQTVMTALEQWAQDWQQAIAQKRRDDAEKARVAELEQQQLGLADLQQQAAQVPEAQKFDAAGQAAVQQALAQVAGAIAQGNPTHVRQPLQQAQQALTQHQATAAAHRAEWRQRQATAAAQVGELQDLLAGLQADPVVMRWQAAEVAQLQQPLTQAAAALQREDFAAVAPLLAASQATSQALIATANAAQLQADQRDYIADSIAQSLEALGFTVRERRLEHPDHPASAIVLGATTHAGRGIGVSVPVAGEVFYDVEGYAKSTVAAVGGGSAAVCDEAEQVIDEMHTVLAAQFGVQMGELQWEGKDPQRQLRRADELPRSEPVRWQRS